MLWQVVEREGLSSFWSVPQSPGPTGHFKTEKEALEAAKEYVSERNVDNALAASEKERSAEVFILDKKGCFLGRLDGQDWYMRYKKNEYDPKNRSTILHKTGDAVKVQSYFELENKTEVAVRQVPGS